MELKKILMDSGDASARPAGKVGCGGMVNAYGARLRLGQGPLNGLTDDVPRPGRGSASLAMEGVSSVSRSI